MAIKPSDGHMDWITDDDSDKYIAPSAAKRLQGWVQQEKPPFQYFNWAWRLIDRWLKWSEAQSDENTTAIAANTQAIADETTARADADSTLQGNIDTEATARTAADTAHANLTDAHGAASSNTASRIVMRDANSDIFSRLFRSEFATPTQCNYFLGQMAVGAGVDNYHRPMTIAQALSALGVAPLINGLTSAWIYAADDSSTGYSTDTGATAVLTLTTPVVAGDVGILVAEFQSFRTGSTSSFGIGLRVGANSINFGDSSGIGWGNDNNNQQSLYGSGMNTHYVTLPFTVTGTNAARVFTLYRSVMVLPGGGSTGSQYHRMAIKWLYKQ